MWISRKKRMISRVIWRRWDNILAQRSWIVCTSSMSADHTSTFWSRIWICRRRRELALAVATVATRCSRSASGTSKSSMTLALSPATYFLWNPNQRPRRLRSTSWNNNRSWPQDIRLVAPQLTPSRKKQFESAIKIEYWHVWRRKPPRYPVKWMSAEIERSVWYER